MKKISHILFVLPLFLGACTGLKLDNIKSEVDSLKSNEVASLSKQVSDINSSVSDLNKLSTEMKSYIEQLKQKQSDLDGQLTGLDSKLDEVKNSFKSELEASKSEVVKQLESVQTALEGKLTDINTVIEVLKEKDAALDSKIDSLKTYSDTTFAAKTWAEATFATIDSQKALIDDITSVKAMIETLNNSISATSSEIAEFIDSSVVAAKTGLDADLKAKVNEITAEYKQCVSDADTQLKEFFDNSIRKPIETCISEVKTWVSDTLGTYYCTVADAEAQIAAMKALLGDVPEGSNLQTEIDTLKSQLAKAKEDLQQDYKDYIKAAIDSSEVKMTGEMSRRISELMTSVINPLLAKVEPLRSEVSKLWNKFESLANRVNTLEEQVAHINESLAVLEELKVTLKEYVESMQRTLERADAQNYKELSSLIKRLDNYLQGDNPNSLENYIVSLKSLVGSIPSGETSVVAWVEKTRDVINEQFKLYATVDSVNVIKIELEALLDGQDETISGIRTKLSTVIQDNKELICTWIDDQLANYWTTDRLNDSLAKVKGRLEGMITSADDSLSKQITLLDKDIRDAEDTLKKKYTNIVDDAISKNNGVITREIDSLFNLKAAEVAKLSGRIDVVSAAVDDLKTEIKQLRKKMFEISDSISIVQTFIKDAGIDGLEPFVREILDSIDHCKYKYASLEEFNKFKIVVQELKDKVDQLNEIKGRIEDSDELADKLSAFFLTGYGEDDSLKKIFDAINKERDTLWNEVYGETSVKEGLQKMIDDINAALYGVGGSPSDPKADGLYSKLLNMVDKIAQCNFNSVAYIPANSDCVAKLEKSGGVYTAKFDFVVRPAAITPLLESGSVCKMVYVETKTRAAELKEFDNVKFEAKDDGILTATVTLSELPKTNISAALSVDLRTDDTPGAANFTSQFVRLSY